MINEKPDDARSAKRLKTTHNEVQGPSTSLKSLSRSITPPPCRRRSPTSTNEGAPFSNSLNVLPSPYQLTHIRDLSNSSGNNNDTIKLRDILGDPLIKECWQFNYLFDIDFLMRQFDEDVRSLVKVKVVHGSWKREAPNRIRIDEACTRYPNVEPIVAYMPEPYGTHHSKMMVLIRHDDQSQVIIHTANMIPGDWANMSQGVWRSPLLPALAHDQPDDQSQYVGAIGSGSRFKRDLCAYFEAYGRKKTSQLVDQLKRYDFSAVRAALIASVPSRQGVAELNSDRQPLWGWPGLKDTLQRVPMPSQATESEKQNPYIVIQISSIATLGQTDKWLKDTFFDSLAPKPTPSRGRHVSPKFSIIFPTPDEIRRSLNGYLSGDSIHMKLQSTAQQKQLQYLRPHLCRWAGDRDAAGRNPGPSHTNPEAAEDQAVREAGRRRAAPHIKTYVRFSDSSMSTIDWAMITSANLSTQAWGAAPNAKREVRICSWEIGVLFWPDLFIDKKESGGGSEKPSGGQQAEKDGSCGGTVTMVTCFKKDIPESPSTAGSGESAPIGDDSGSSATIGFRMPYDTPLTPYTRDDMPWCATSSYSEPDWLGQTWEEQ